MPGRLLGDQYQVIQPLGSGGMGQVLLANDLTLDRFVAIKLLRPDLSNLFDKDARIRREARLLSRLNHPNVVVLYAFGSAAPQVHYIVMEYVRGETLEQRLQQGPPLDFSSVQHIMAQICSAVAEAHKHGIVHRDLKPANVLLTPMAGDPLFVKVVDFGIAKMLVPDESLPLALNLTAEEGILGTPAYIAPEQLRSSIVDGRADIYALGIIACELITGQRPFDESRGLAHLLADRLHADPILPSQLRRDLGQHQGLGLDAVIARALARDPVDRYQYVDEFLHDLLRELAPGDATRSRRPLSSLPHLDSLRVYEETLDHGEVVRNAAPGEPTVPLPLGEQPAAPADPVATLNGGLAPQVLRNVTVLYVDLVQDARTAGIELDEYLDCLSLVGARLQRVVEQHRGGMLGPIADRALVLLRPEGASENDAERAIDAALAACSALSALSSDPTIPAPFQIAVRVGIDTGQVVTVQAPGGAAVLHGAPLFTARRLAHAAVAGQVSISHAVYRRIRGLYETEVASEGVAESPARVVLAKKSTAHLRQNEIHGVRISLIGRDREMRVLRDALAHAVATRRPQVLVVSGSRGVGKSRLVADFIKEIEDRRDERYFLEIGRCTPAWQGLPYEPFIEAIRHRARLLDDDTPDQVRAKLEHSIRRYLLDDPTLFGEAERRLLRVLSMLLGLQDQGAERDVHEVSGEEPRRKLMFDAVTSLFQRLASRFPLIFLIEDFELATGPTRALLSHALAWMGEQPALFVLMSRTDGDAAPDLSFFRDPSSVATLSVPPLDREAGDALVRHVLRELIDVPSWLVRRIAQLAEGVPLIVEETVHDLIDHGVIAVADGRWRLTASADTHVSLPDNLDQLFFSRIERLDPPLRQALEAAAVAGRRFWPSLLAELTQGAASDPAVVAELVRRGFFVERRDVILQGELDYCFAKTACQEVAYRNIPRARRRALHKAAALWLERWARGAGGLHDDAIGHHFRESGELARALPYARRAAARAMQTHAIEEAVRLLNGCKDILSQIAGAEMLPDARQKQLTTIVASLVHQLVLIGDLQRAVALADEVLPAVAPLDRETAREIARLLIWKGWALHHLGRFAEARVVFVAAQQRLAGEQSLLALMALTGEVGTSVHLFDQGDAADRLRRALAERREAPASQEWERGLSSARRVLANQELHAGRYDVCEQEYRAAYDLALSANAPVEAVDALNGLAALYYFRGQLDQAESSWRAAVAQAAQWDLLQHRSVILSNLGELELARGDTEAARATLQHAEALFRHLGAERGLAETHRALAECDLLLGELDRARVQTEKALEIARRVQSPYLLGTVHRTAARVVHAVWKRGGGAEARAQIERHLDASAEALGAAGMQKLAEETNVLRAELLAPG